MPGPAAGPRILRPRLSLPEPRRVHRPTLQRRHIDCQQAEGIGVEQLTSAAAVAMDGEGQAQLYEPADGEGAGIAGGIEGRGNGPELVLPSADWSST